MRKRRAVEYRSRLPMASGVADHVLAIEEIAKLLESDWRPFEIRPSLVELF